MKNWIALSGLLVVSAVFPSKLLAAEPKGIVTGRVLADDGTFLTGVRIEARRPINGAANASHSTAWRIETTTTDRDGRYKFELTTTEGTYVRIRPLAPGYRSADSIRRPGGAIDVSIAPGKTSGCSFVLQAAAYIAGDVIDDVGRPVAEVSITAEADDQPYPTHAYTVTDKQGRFEIFELPSAPEGTKTTVKLTLSRAGYLKTTFNDVNQRTPAQRTALRIVLSKGRAVSGRLVDEAGNPVAKTMVEALFESAPKRQATLSDDAGRFTLTGLPDDRVTIRAHDFAARSKAAATIALKGNRNDVELTLRRVASGKPPNGFKMIGLEVADITPELQAYYDLPTNRGVVVLGRAMSEIPFGAEVGEGTCFERAWFEDIANLEQLLVGMLREMNSNDPSADGKLNCQVFYRVRSVDGHDLQGDRIRLDPAQVGELTKLLDMVRKNK